LTAYIKVKSSALIEARTPSEITRLEALAGTTQPAAVDYAIERSGLRDCFPGFAGGRGTPPPAWPPPGDFPGARSSIC
jgi:hypothetical protein